MIASMSADPVRFGIVGCGRIASGSIAPAIRAVPGAVLAAAASRDLQRAEALLPHRAYGSARALLDDPAVEVVYVASHNGEHRDLTLAALAAGKHVMCEKPLGRNPAEVVEMTRAAAGAGRELVEAFMYRFHPQMTLVKKLVAEGAIGELQHVDSHFTFELAGDEDVRLVKEWGGGALMDVGCYCTDFTLAHLGGEPAQIAVDAARFHPRHDVDLHLKVRMEWESGVQAAFECGFDAPFAQRAVLRGALGSITLEQPWVSWQERPRIVLENGAGRQVLDAGFPSPFELEIAHMARLVRGREPARFPLSDTLAVSRVMERIATAAFAR
jgi:predicted dehydrogenase